MLHLSDAAATDGDGSEFQLNIGCVPLHLCRGISSAINNIGTNLSTVVSSAPPIRLLATQLGLLERVAACVSANWLVLLSGQPHVGKRSTVRTLATLVDQPLEHIRLTSETDALELLGSFEQIQNQQQTETTANCGGEEIGGDGTIKAEQMDCGDELVDNGHEAETGDSSGKSNLRFEWVDSVFVRAFRDGHWLLVEDVNCCSSAVLDCLNSCLESADGELVLPVQQHQQSDIAAGGGTQLEDSKVRRHANFRIFFTMNPKNGQLSRAMRNRAVELAFGMDTVSVTAAAASAIEPPVWSANAVDVVSAVPTLPRPELLSSSSSNSVASPIVPASSKQLQLVSQLQHKLNGSIDCAELLCCAAQVQHCIATANDNNGTLIGQQQQQFLARLELFLQSLHNSLKTHDDGDDNDWPSPLGFNIFPHVLRPCASTIRLCYDELSLYYWHCWSDVSTVHVHNNKHADACLQLAFMFPGSFIAQKRMWPAALRLGFFGTINESRQKELLSLLSMNMASDHHHQYHVQSDDFVQLLLEHTFPLESRVWSDPRKLAVNDTEIGRNYLAALRASPAHCHPFYSASEMQLYMQQWLGNNNFGKVGECLDNKNATIFQYLGHHFAQIVHFLNRIFDDNQSRMTTTLPWGAVVAAGDDDDGVMAATERAFSFGLIGSAYLVEHLNGKDLSSSRLPFFSHLQLPFITRGLNECLWNRLHFDPGHVLRHMRVAELVNVSAQLDHAFMSIWELCFARKNVHKATRELFRNVAAQFGVDIQPQPNVGGANHVFDSSQLFAMLAKLVDALTSLTPPQQLMDPPAFTQLQRNYWRERLKQVAVYVNALQMFLQLTNAKSYDTDQLVAAVICCSSFPLSPCSSTSILRQICAVHRDISNSLLQLEPEKTAPSNDDELPKSTVFRCWLSNLDQFRHDFVHLLRNASAHLSKAIGSVTEDASNLLLQRTNNTTSSSRADVVQQNIHNILTTISTLKALLTTNQREKSSFDSTLSEVPFLFVYPDLVAPYLHVLNLLSIALSEIGRQIASAQNIERVHLNYDFSHSAFYGLNQLLHCSSQSAVISAANNDFAIDVQPFIRWLITDQQTPLTVSDRLPICLWSIAVPCRRPFSQCRADVLGWLLHLWEQWHEQNAKIKAKEQLVVKRKRKRRKQNGEEELEMMDDGGDECVHMESDDQKLRDAYLPDFSNSASDNNNHPTPSHLDAAAVVVADQFSVSKDEVHDALCNLFKTLSSNDEDDEAFANSSFPPPPFMPLLSVIGKLELFGSATNQTENDEDLAYPQLLALDKLREQLQLCAPFSTKFPSLSSSKSAPEVPKAALNVYRDSEPSAVVKCVECLAPLHQRVQLLLDEFPENGQLSSLSFTIDAFVNKASAGVPLMKHAAQLESILVRAEEWESIADRAHSIREQMVPLQALLVEWRRREVHCWAELVNMVRADCTQLAVLAGWPLFKCALDTLKNEEQQQQQNGAVPADENNNKNTLILAFVDWMHNATVGDFGARLWTGQLLIKCLPVLAPPNCAIVVGTLCRHMRSTCAHFAQFNRTLQAHFDDRFAPVQRSLHDFCRAVRYTDLNVWSVQDSARRAHTHLVRILRSFKNLNDEPVFPLLFEKPSPPLEWVTPTPSELDSLPQPNALAQTDHHQQQQTIGTAVLSRFVTRLEASVVQMLGGVDALDVLRTDAMAMLNELQTNIVYESVVVDPQPLVAHKPGDHDNNVQSVNEKRHGRALFVRQQQFSRLVRAAARIGLNVRRAQHIDTEKLTMQTVAEADALHHLSDTIGTHFRHSTAARNVFLRQFAIFRRHNSQQQEQLTPATLEQLRSIVEYTLHWMLNAVTALGGDQQRFGAAHRRAVHVARCIAVEAQNAADAVAASIGHAEDYGSFSSSHLCLSDQFVRNDKLISALTAVVDQMRKLHQICPRQQQHSDAVQIDKEHQEQSQSSSTTTSSSIPVSLHGSAVQTPLGSLRQPSTEHAELDAELSTLDQLLERLKRCHSDVQIGSVPIPCDSRHLRIWNRTMWRTYIECLNAVHATFSELSLAKLGDYFVDQFAELGPIFDQLLSAVNTTEIGNQQQHQTEFECVESAVLLYLQSIYKEVEQYSSNNNANDGDGIGSSAPPPPLLDCVKRVLEFVNKLNSEKVLTQLYDWFLANSSVNTTISSPMVADRLAKAYTLAHGLSSALCHLHHHIGTFAAQLASFHAHWSAVGCHLLANGFVNPIPIVDRQKGGDEADGKRAEAGDGFGDGDLAPNATDVSSQVENMEQIEGLKNDGSDQQQQQMDDQENNADQQQQQQHKMDESEQPIDVEDDFAGCLEALDAGEDDEQGIDGEDNDDEQQQREDIDDRADWNFGEVEEPEETQLDPKLWEDEQNDEQQAEEREQQDNNETMDHAKGDQRQMLDDDDDACAKNDDTNADQQEMDQSQVEGADKADWTAAGQEEEGDKAKPTAAADEHAEEHGEADGDDQQQNEGDVDNEQQQQKIDEANQQQSQPVDGEENFAGQLEGLDAEEGEEGNEDDNEAGAGEEQEETQLDPKSLEDEQNEQQQTEEQGQQQQDSNETGDHEKGWGVQQQQQSMDNGDDDACADNNDLRNNVDDQQRRQQQRLDQSQADGADEADWTAGQDEGDKAKPTAADEPAEEHGDAEGDDQQQQQNMEDDGAAGGDHQRQLQQQEMGELSAHGSASLEQARQTRALFHSHLRRLRQQQQQQQQLDQSQLEGADQAADDQKMADQDEEAAAAMLVAREEEEEGMAESVGCNFGDLLNGPEVMRFDPKLWQNDEEQNDDGQQQQSKEEAMEMEEEREGTSRDDGDDQQQQLQHRLQLKWALITDSVAPLAAELAESLRAIIEPTIASRLEGDYRTGKRLNMRRLIPYIASDYRKDRIWMRRTRKARRNYQICIAVDNSQSMQHNHMTEITCNALCLIERALRQLEVGQLALCSFGSQVQLIADFAASEHDDHQQGAVAQPLGARILRQLRFDQQRTDLGQLLDVTRTMFTRARDAGCAPQHAVAAEQLLIIIGDGRGVFSEGAQRIRQAIGRLFADRVTVLFLVMDVPPPPTSASTAAGAATSSHKSIMDMRIADFSADGQSCTFRSYMAQFPFPLYALVRDTRTVPATVAEAVRQWFEHTANG
ncbi:hypothetical protein niasHS_016101 [Heterodera schachtii]|uniref:VWFA domain-containing protein n=1 Tax=Heterodera schachtii TaxID=97005 RepID=A0ABD2HQP2_HETSC